jgi:hypothetical protein
MLCTAPSRLHTSASEALLFVTSPDGSMDAPLFVH